MQNILELLRVRQWNKNIVIFIPIFFAGELLDQTSLIHTLSAFLSLCLLSSSTYVLNDILDAKRDKHHPVKKYRPIPAGKISIIQAVTLLLTSLIISIVVALLLVRSEYFLLFMVVYFITMMLYSTWLKHVGIVDSITISLGFVLRVIAGAIILQIELSALLLVAIIGAAILISFGKRKAEISAMSYDDAVEHRPALSVYPKGALDSIISSIAAVTFTAYILFTYSYTAKGLTTLLHSYLPPLFKDPHWLLITIPVAFYVLARYLVLIYDSKSERPEDIWINDKLLRNGLMIWVIILFLLIYLPQLHTMF